MDTDLSDVQSEAPETTDAEEELSQESQAPSQESTDTGLPDDPYQSQEFLQKKLYFLLEQLKKMHNTLPEQYQLRISYELLAGLANSLLNDTIFEIVKGLMEIQHVTEKHLMQVREKVENDHQLEVQQWESKIQDPEELSHIIALMKIKHTKNLKETDMKLVLHLDQKVKDQQSTLEKAGVPGFYVTDNPKEIKIQMYLLDFILRLGRLKFEPNK
ncbi:gonadal protein gdl-like [Uranotaenia lowii]|uniref:gonadal protein gdl n=1 Tax=Uranotaenia lowii TaxID=190385 RepID=UPI0024797B52|nr:gonadal protein gdl [Uranotaenia lowii]XP_055598430.1 gonadal protein gdl [Uranotaenia lowii]XP_055608897.1 gonadal protein gdl-like [Uranotaenia lowii]XP_055608898.1 gonadal protein gdl-like [Uranotaenia lowii]